MVTVVVVCCPSVPTIVSLSYTLRQNDTYTISIVSRSLCFSLLNNK